MKYTRQELYDAIWAESAAKVAERLGVPQYDLRKCCQLMDIPTPSNGYRMKIKYGYDAVQTPLTHDGGNRHEVEIVEGKILGVSEDKHPSPLELRIQQIEAENISIFKVPKILKAKDPLIIDTLEYHRGTPNHRKESPYTSQIKNVLDVRVSNQALRRSLLIFSVLINAFKKRGHTVIVKDHVTSVVIKNEKIRIGIREKQKREKNPEEDYPKFIYVRTGKLIFEVDNGYYSKTEFCETDSEHLEDMLIRITAFLEKEADGLIERRILAIERERIEKEKRIQREEQNRRQTNELEKFRALFTEAERYHRAMILREYIDAYEKHAGLLTDEQCTWIQWARNKVDWYDPFVEKEDELLDKFDKNKSLQV